MPGPLVHLWSASQTLKVPEVIPEGCAGAFFYGSVALDFGYGPGSDPLWSDLPHYIGSITFAKRLLELAGTPDWEAFGKGWLLHLCLDVYAHPIINRFAANHYGGNKDCNRGLTYEENAVAHAKIEAGLDLTVLDDYHSFDSNTLNFPGDITLNCPLVQAYRDCYAQNIDLNKFREAIGRYPDILEKLIRWQARLNGCGQPKSIVGRVGRTVGWFLAELLKLSLGRERGGIVAGLIHPDLPTIDECITYKEVIHTGIRIWREIITGEKPWLNNDFNLDTGEISRRGEYGLADKMMDYLLETNSTEKVRKRFGKDADKILCRWEKICSSFEGT